ncbi:MAG TPA: alpha/beta fold hydrolase [Gammaproteobacteria bacterium]|nr:alpha/beta fold hydrolase [Gammaproteobacteria bacterium]
MQYAIWVFAVLASCWILPAAHAGEPRQTSVQLKTPTGVLYGTLELPAGKGPWPVALIVAGSGPTDRNGNSPIGLSTDAYKLLASPLASRGIATLRYDKRGIAQSAPAGPLESELRFTTYVDDAVAWGKQLAADSRFSTLTILGHSEGSLIGMLAAPRIPADAFVSISGAGEPAGSLLLAQLKPKLPEKLYRKAEHIVAQLNEGKTVADVPSNMAMLFHPSVQPYLISWFRYDPAKAIAKLRMPVLIVQGERDIQVPVSAAKKLAKADPAARLVLIPKMNHVLKDVGPTREDNLAAYQNPKLPIDTVLVKSIGQFIKRVQQAGGHDEFR